MTPPFIKDFGGLPETKDRKTGLYSEVGICLTTVSPDNNGTDRTRLVLTKGPLTFLLPCNDNLFVSGVLRFRSPSSLRYWW